MSLFVRPLRADERNRLDEMLRVDYDGELARRAQIVLLSTQRVSVREISHRIGMHPINVRKWLHRFNVSGLKGLYPRRSPGRPRLFSDEQRKAIIGLATTDPQELGLSFDTWSLQRLRVQLIEQGIAPEISAETIRQELLRSGLTFAERHWIASDE